MPNDPPRLAPDYSFPPYSYVPGLFPHPIRDPAGHCFGAKRGSPECLDPETWWNCRPYLIGIDLFNHGYYWEAHEVWEGVWHACGRRGVAATFVKGLIKLAAAGVKRRERRHEGVSSHPRRARQHFEEIRELLPAGTAEYSGLLLTDLLQFTREAEELAVAPLPGQARPVEVAFPFLLRPQCAP
jgi:predicted metal-dependent hydrolase